MIRISRKTDYAVRILLALSLRPFGTWVPTRDIWEEMQIPKNLAVQITSKLVRLGFLESQPGRKGGIRLARLPETITLQEVVKRLERSFSLSACLSNPVICPFEAFCPVRRHWARLQQILLEEMGRITLAQLAQEARATPFGHRLYGASLETTP